MVIAFAQGVNAAGDCLRESDGGVHPVNSTLELIEHGREGQSSVVLKPTDYDTRRHAEFFGELRDRRRIELVLATEPIVRLHRNEEIAGETVRLNLLDVASVS